MVITPVTLRAILKRPMIVRRFEPHRASFPVSRWLLLIAIGLETFFVSPPAQAHAPFDSNARVTVLEQTIEATVTVGAGLTELLLKDSGVQSFPNQGVGMGTILPVELASRFFELEASGQRISASQLRVLSDGLEALYVVTYPRPTGETFRLRAQFARHLPATNFCALVLVDDSNQLLGSHIVKVGSETADFNLPKTPDAIVAATTPAPVVAHISAPAETVPTPLTTQPSEPRWRFGLLIIIAALVALGGWWVVQKSFCREQN